MLTKTRNSMLTLINDMNLSVIDVYIIQEPMTWMKQHMNYEHWYERRLYGSDFLMFPSQFTQWIL